MSVRRKLRVLSIAHPAVKTSIGRQRYCPLADMGDLDVHLLVPSHWRENGQSMSADPGPARGVTLHTRRAMLTYLPKIQWYAHFYPGLGRLIGELRPDVIHLWEEPWSAIAFLACRLKGDAALVLEVEQNILRRLPQPFEAMRRYVLKHTHQVLSRSDASTMVVRKCGFEGGITPMGYGVDLETFSPLPNRIDRDALRPLRLGYCGRLVVQKGIDDILDALAMMTDVPFEFSIAGSGAHAQALQQRVKTLGLTDHVQFSQWTGQKRVADFFRAQDVSILYSRSMPTWREQFGRAIIESQGCGTPVIGSDSGSIPAVTGGGGWTVPERSPKHLAHLIEHIWRTQGEIGEKREIGLANVASQYTYAIIARQLATAWRKAARAQSRVSTDAQLYPKARS